MLTFKAPYKNDEPTKSSVAYGASPMDMANNVVGFPGQAGAAKSQRGGARTHGPMAVTPRELEAITDKIAITRNNVENCQDKTLTDRLMTVEGQIHKLTVLVSAFMVLAIAMVAALTFLGLRGNLVHGAIARQPQEIAAAAHRGSPEALTPAIVRQAASVAPMVPANEQQLSQAPAMIPSGEVQPVSAAATPGATVVTSPEVKTAPAAPEPAPHFVGSLTSNKIHVPECKWAAKINAKNLITFPSLAAAREQGYIPCPVCRPHEADETH
jgi:hypothetical protein